MANGGAGSSPVVVGRYRPARAPKSRRRLFVPLLLAAFALAGLGLPLGSLPLLVAGLALAGAAWLLSRRRKPPAEVELRLEGRRLTASGAGYDFELDAPFRFQTGVERKTANDDGLETCFVRMALDARGKPLVLEERVLEGYVPPPLPEIHGLGSALGIAELSSLMPYPGPLWALIQELEALKPGETRESGDAEVESLLREGARQMGDGVYAGAVETLTAALRMQPDSARAYYLRGAARYGGNRDLDKAINDLTTALRLEPNQPEAYRTRGLARARQGDWAGLRDDCSQAMRAQPHNADLFNLRGTACFRLSDYEAALANFERAIALVPNKPESHYNRGLARRHLGQRAEAAADFQRALALNPAFEQARRELEAARRRSR